jgi:hypothetical protein
MNMTVSRPARLLAATLVLIGSSSALAQSNISTALKYNWTENAGWLNWRDAGSPAASQGVRIGSSIMSGHVWSENVGYITLGDGTPNAGTQYTNSSGTDHGVNIGADGRLSGYAWGENIGWVNFDTFSSLWESNQYARFDRASGRLQGFAWSENIGWINLGNTSRFVAIACRADFNGDGFVNSQDFFDFVNAFFALDPSANYNGDAFINSQDYFDFLTAFFGDC